MNDNILYSLNILSSLENINEYPFNLNDKLYDNIIETKKEIELEYIKNYKLPVYQEKDKKNIKGAYEHTIYIY